MQAPNSQAALEQEIVVLAQQGAFAKIAHDLEEFEYDAAENSKDVQPLYGVQLLTYLIQNDLNNARFLWKRIPNKVKDSDPELNAIWKIGKHIWQKKYAQAYQAMQAYNWSPGTVLFIQALAEKFRERTFQLIGHAYSNISISDLATLIGLSEQDAVTLAVKHGWEVDRASNSITVKPILAPKEQGTSTAQLQQLTDYVCFLEEN